MAANTVLGKGTGIYIKIGTGTFTKIAGVTGFSGLGGGSAAVIDATDLDSDFKEKRIGIPDEGQFKLEYNEVDGDAGQEALADARTSGDLVTVEVRARNTARKFGAYVLTNEWGGKIDDINKYSATLEVSGAVTTGPATV